MSKDPAEELDSAAEAGDPTEEELAAADEAIEQLGEEGRAAADEESTGDETEGEDGGQGDLFGTRLTDDRLRSVLESLIFASPRPIGVNEMIKVLGRIARKRVKDALDAMIAEGEQQAASGARGFVLREVAGGYHYRTVADNAFWLKKLQKSRPWRLTQPTLEVLAILAYKQPLTRAEVDQLRGVDSSAIITKLIEKKLVKPVGRKEVPGWPMMYGTSNGFLEFFGLKNLKELPTLREIRELTELGEEVQVPEELRQWEDEQRRRIEAEQDGLLDEEELLDENGNPIAPQEGEAAAEGEGVSFGELSGEDSESSRIAASEEEPSDMEEYASDDSDADSDDDSENDSDVEYDEDDSGNDDEDYEDDDSDDEDEDSEDKEE